MNANADTVQGDWASRSAPLPTTTRHHRMSLTGVLAKLAFHPGNESPDRLQTQSANLPGRTVHIKRSLVQREPKLNRLSTQTLGFPLSRLLSGGNIKVTPDAAGLVGTP